MQFNEIIINVMVAADAGVALGVQEAATTTTRTTQTTTDDLGCRCA